MAQPPYQPSSLVSQTDFRMRLLAFLVTSMAVFVFACLVWPLTVSTFRTAASINVSAGSSVDSNSLEQMLVEATRLETTPDSIDRIIDEIEEGGKPNSKSLEYRDHEKIKSSIQLGVAERPGGYRLQVVYDGQGGEDEKSLVDKIAFRVAKRVSTSPSTASMDETAIGSSDDMNVYEFETSAGADDLATILEQARWVMDQVESDLKFVSDSLASSSQLEGSNQLSLQADDESFDLDDNQSSFMNASSSRVVRQSDQELHQSIESIDVDSLRNIINRIEASVAASDAGSTGVIVNGIDPGQTIPLNGVPGFAPMMLFAMVSALIGSVVAWNFDPFETRGFDGIQHVADTLGIPVLTTLQSDGRSDQTGQAVKQKVSIPNQIVRICGLLLFGVFVVIAVFVILNPAVREVFFSNPFYGCTKIVRVFAGY
ncbi:MAG: hypothetical protein AB8B55_08100 [Mariniblastus sp.]